MKHRDLSASSVRSSPPATRRRAIWMTGTAAAAAVISTGALRAGNKTRMPGGMGLAYDRDLPTPGAVTGVAWSSDGRILAGASYYGQYVTVWEESGTVLSRIQRIGGGPYPYNSIALLKGGAQLLFPPGDDGGDHIALDLWDVKSATVIRQIPGPAPNGDYARNRAVHFDVSSDRAVVIGAPSVGKTYVAWRADGWTTERVEVIPNGIASIKLFPDGRRAAIGSFGGRGRSSICSMAARPRTRLMTRHMLEASCRR